MPRAAIDIGSNTVLLTVVDDSGAVIHDEARVVGLGRGLGERGLFRPDRMKAAETALGDYAKTAQRLGVEPWAIKAVATSAARRAMNAPTWFSRLQRTTGLRVRVISGDEEARLTWLGAIRELPVREGPLLVVDLGGGSTELVLGTIGPPQTEGPAVGRRSLDVHHRVSLELGSVRLTEQYFGDGYDQAEAARFADLRNHVRVELKEVRLDPMPRTVIGVAGTATTLAATALGLRDWNAARVHGSSLTRSDLARFVDELLPLDADQRRAWCPVSPERADYLLAGSVVLDQVLFTAGRPKMIASDRGLRFGLLAGG